MNPNARFFVVFLLVSSWLAACGSQVVEFGPASGAGAGTDGGTDGSALGAPTVTSTLPANGSTLVPLGSSLTASFDDDMDPVTIDGSAFVVKQGATSVSGAVTYAAGTRTASFAPSAPLANDATYTATITTGAKNAGGVPLRAAYTWSFSTGKTIELNDAPTVTASSPPKLATNVSINRMPTATFSTAMDAATINASTFTLMQGTSPIAGTVTLDAATNTATFAPSSKLGLGLVYTATITTGAKSTKGVPLAASYVWTFTTGACSQASVALGTGTGFAVLGGSTVTSSGATIVTGDLGVSPGTAVTGFGPGTVVGTQHAGDSAAAAARVDFKTAYDELAGRTLCAVTVAGNLGGTTLYPGLYKSTSSLEITSGDLTLDALGDSSAVFVFQMASTLTTTSGRQVILAGGAKAANIYWLVGSSATLGTTTAFHGTILADVAVTLNNGATLTGRTFAYSGAVTMENNTITKPAP